MICWTEYDFGCRSDGTDFCLTKEAVDKRLKTATFQFRPDPPREVIIDNDLYEDAKYDNSGRERAPENQWVHISERDEYRLKRIYALEAKDD